MPSRQQQVCERLQQRFPDLDTIRVDGDLVAMDVPTTRLIDVCTCLRDEPALAFAQLTDLCGVDMAGYGKGLLSLCQVLPLPRNMPRRRGVAWAASRASAIASTERNSLLNAALEYEWRTPS